VYESIENLDNTRGMEVKDWVTTPSTRQEIMNRFKNFLKSFTDAKGQKIYLERIKHMGEDNHTSIELDYNHLAEMSQELALFLPQAPEQMLPIMNEALKVKKKILSAL